MVVSGPRCGPRLERCGASQICSWGGERVGNVRAGGGHLPPPKRKKEKKPHKIEIPHFSSMGTPLDGARRSENP